MTQVQNSAGCFSTRSFLSLKSGVFLIRYPEEGHYYFCSECYKKWASSAAFGDTVSKHTKCEYNRVTPDTLRGDLSIVRY